ncbi:MAG TPA: hypothetical protein VLR44_01290, partial [Rhodoferax sp.]|nr:hypothetical protein [Rhodoferax sp.]
RKDLLQQAGLKVPTNFDELEAAAKKLNSESVAGIASRGKGAAAVTQVSSYIYNTAASISTKARRFSTRNRLSTRCAITANCSATTAPKA